MRWPWRHRGQRRRRDVLVQRATVSRDATWGDAFLPETLTPVAAPTSTVRLGFSDGSEVELDESAVMTSSLLAAARALVGRERPHPR